MFGDDVFRMSRAFEPWRDLARLQDEVNRLFSGAREVQPHEEPALNVWTNEEGAFLEAALPGVRHEDLELSVFGDSVTVTAKRAQAQAENGATVHRRERLHGTWTRTLQLPFRIESDKVHAKLQRGVLEVMLPRAQADRPKKISLK